MHTGRIIECASDCAEQTNLYTKDDLAPYSLFGATRNTSLSASPLVEQELQLHNAERAIYINLVNIDRCTVSDVHSDSIKLNKFYHASVSNDSPSTRHY